MQEFVIGRQHSSLGGKIRHWEERFVTGRKGNLTNERDKGSEGLGVTQRQHVPSVRCRRAKDSRCFLWNGVSGVVRVVVRKRSPFSLAMLRTWGGESPVRDATRLADFPARRDRVTLARTAGGALGLCRRILKRVRTSSENCRFWEKSRTRNQRETFRSCKRNSTKGIAEKGFAQTFADGLATHETNEQRGKFPSTKVIQQTGRAGYWCAGNGRPNGPR